MPYVAPRTQKMTSSAMFVAWSATRSRLRATSSASSAWRVVSGSFVHGLHQHDEGFVLHAVDHVVHLEHGLRQFGLAFDE